MRKFLNGGAGTGSKIIENNSIFKYKYQSDEKMCDNKIMYRFSWEFDNYQYGYINIILNEDGNYIDESSVINTDKGSPRKFSRPLGLYNDSSLLTVYEDMLKNIR